MPLMSSDGTMHALTAEGVQCGAWHALTVSHASQCIFCISPQLHYPSLHQTFPMVQMSCKLINWHSQHQKEDKPCQDFSSSDKKTANWAMTGQPHFQSQQCVFQHASDPDAFWDQFKCHLCCNCCFWVSKSTQLVWHGCQGALWALIFAFWGSILLGRECVEPTMQAHKSRTHARCIICTIRSTCICVSHKA